WNSSFSSRRSASSNKRPWTRSTKLRASKVRPERRGPVRIVALTGHMLHLRKWSKAARLASDTMKRESPSLVGQSSGSAIWSAAGFIPAGPPVLRLSQAGAAALAAEEEQEEEEAEAAAPPMPISP